MENWKKVIYFLKETFESFYKNDQTNFSSVLAMLMKQVRIN